MYRRSTIGIVCFFALLSAICCCGRAEIVARCGQGYLETIDGYRVLHLKGTPYEMGYQQGTLLSAECKALLHDLFDGKLKESKYELFGVKASNPASTCINFCNAAAVYPTSLHRRDAGARRCVTGRCANGVCCELHSGAVSLQRVCRDECEPLPTRHALPWPRARLRRRHAVAGPCCSDRRGTGRAESRLRTSATRALSARSPE